MFIIPSPSLSNKENASLYSAICSFVGSFIVYLSAIDIYPLNLLIYLGFYYLCKRCVFKQLSYNLVF